MRLSIVYSTLCLGLLATGLLAHAQSSINVQYGKVVQVNMIDLNPQQGSNAGKGAVVGGLVSLGTSSRSTSGRKRRSLGLGAAAGAAVGKATDKKSQGFEYTVRLINNNQTVRFVTEQGGINQNDCVSLETGHSNNIRQVAHVFCESKNEPVYQEHQQEANSCDQAKQAVLDAKSDEAVNAAVKKARIACND